MTFPFRNRGRLAADLALDDPGWTPPGAESPVDALLEGTNWTVDVVSRNDSWSHTNDRLAAVLAALLSRPEQVHMGTIYVANGKYADRLHIHGSVTLDGPHAEAVRSIINASYPPPQKPRVHQSVPDQPGEQEAQATE